MATQIVRSVFIRGVEGHGATVTAKIDGGLPSFTVTGLGEAAAREVRVRVQAAIQNAGFEMPRGRVEVSIASRSPMALPKNGAGFDLPVAMAILGATEQKEPLFDDVYVGELSLSGEVRPVRGVFAMAKAVAAVNATIVCAPENAQEALAAGCEVRAVRRLGDVGELPARLPEAAPVDGPDMVDVRGLAAVVREVEAALVAGKNILFVGGPGVGKTMIARRIVSLLPDMTETEKDEVTVVRSAAGLNIGGGRATTRPFRAPHHSTSAQGLVGGGAGDPRPGEVALAHGGVLFLDELPEFQRVALESLAETVKDGRVLLTRASGSVRYPAKCLLIAAMNPCPCGQAGRRCSCTAAEIERYKSRCASFVDRCNMAVINIPERSLEEIVNGAFEGSATIKARIAKAREEKANG